MEKIKIFLLDDHKIVRDGLKSILSTDPAFKVIGEESHPEKFFAILPKTQIDILVLDISLPVISGMEVLKKVKAEHPEIQVVMLSMHDNPDYILRSLREGANAYLPKDIKTEEFIIALKEVRAKGVYYPTQINFNQSDNLVPSKEAAPRDDLLTPKEKDVLENIAKGLSSKQIAAQYGLSSRTIEAHRLNIMKKLGTNNSAETIAMALKLNLLQSYISR